MRYGCVSAAPAGDFSALVAVLARNNEEALLTAERALLAVILPVCLGVFIVRSLVIENHPVIGQHVRLGTQPRNDGPVRRPHVNMSVIVDLCALGINSQERRPIGFEG